ncbi:unnamed protein product [Pleuronectes platessa]|uniref:Calmodulin binding transcription activator 1 n=1 Tax=Pleuronectes platessa TaxID=8262 RepID=A0A9N7TKP9_PLEPL|nr:unnamed protein product [Pleuronectes platessa]
MAAENKPEDEHGHLKIYLPKKLLECLPKCTSLPKERHRWNTNEVCKTCELPSKQRGAFSMSFLNLKERYP